MKSRILLVEDDPGLGATLLERLQREGYRAVLATSKSEALRQFESSISDDPFDLLILDVGLPDGSGLDFARDVRLTSSVPIVFLSAISSAGYRLEGFEIGAEDYIPKPFHVKELLLRIGKVLERNQLEGKILFGNFTIDFESRSVSGPDAETVFLSSRDSDVLKYLIEAHPKIVSRQELLKNIWKEDGAEQSGRTVDNCIVRLRQQLKPFHPECIRSARGIGYQWLLEQGKSGTDIQA